MQVDLFDFKLPPACIAARPAAPRDCARLLHVGQNVGHSGLGDHIVRDLPALLSPGDVLVLNDTRVLPARLTGKRGAARIEVTLHHMVEDGVWGRFLAPGQAPESGPGNYLCGWLLGRCDVARGSGGAPQFRAPGYATA